MLYLNYCAQSKCFISIIMLKVESHTCKLSREDELPISCNIFDVATAQYRYDVSTFVGNLCKKFNVSEVSP